MLVIFTLLPLSIFIVVHLGIERIYFITPTGFRNNPRWNVLIIRRSVGRYLKYYYYYYYHNYFRYLIFIFFIIFNCLGYFIYIFGYLFLYFQSQAMGRPAMIIQVYSEKHKHRPHEAQGKLGKQLEKSVLRIWFHWIPNILAH